MENRVLVTICGRAGSKGFKNKNLKTFFNYPLVYYTLSAADLFKQQTREDTVVDICLNTDSEELHRIVQDKYPEVYYIKRDIELAGSDVPKPAVWKNCIDLMQEKQGFIYDYMIDLDITSPLRQVCDVYNAFQLKLDRKDADLVESMCPARRNPYFNMMREEGCYVKTVIDCSFVTRQQAPNIYDENASIYVIRAGFFKENRYIMNEAKTIPYIMRDTAVLDIDSEDDYILMEIIARYLYENDNQYKIVRDNIRE